MFLISKSAIVGCTMFSGIAACRSSSILPDIELFNSCYDGLRWGSRIDPPNRSFAQMSERGMPSKSSLYLLNLGGLLSRA